MYTFCLSMDGQTTSNPSVHIDSGFDESFNIQCDISLSVLSAHCLRDPKQKVSTAYDDTWATFIRENTIAARHQNEENAPEWSQP